MPNATSVEPPPTSTTATVPSGGSLVAPQRAGEGERGLLVAVEHLDLEAGGVAQRHEHGVAVGRPSRIAPVATTRARCAPSSRIRAACARHGRRQPRDRLGADRAASPGRSLNARSWATHAQPAAVAGSTTSRRVVFVPMSMQAQRMAPGRRTRRERWTPSAILA